MLQILYTNIIPAVVDQLNRDAWKLLIFILETEMKQNYLDFFLGNFGENSLTKNASCLHPWHENIKNGNTWKHSVLW